MSHENIRSIYDIIDYSFTIPDFQRRYRWRAKFEVKDLLDDLDHFFKNMCEDSYYCLQPLVVKKENAGSDYTVIDGQQRLTTLYLINKFIEGEDLYSISFLNRPRATEALSNIHNNNSNINFEYDIDLYHINSAYKGIQTWFNSNKGSEELFKQNLQYKVKFIWYEAVETEDEIAIFQRLNIGKIPLTDMELVKALFLSEYSENDIENIQERAKILYEREYKLRQNNDKIFGLYSNELKKQSSISEETTRTEIFFASFVTNNKDKKYPLFSYLFDQFKQDISNLDNEWNEFKKRSEILLRFGDPIQQGENQYKIRKLYHYIGYLIYSEAETLKSIWKIWQKYESIDSIVDALRNIIKLKIKNSLKDRDIEELTYNDSQDKKIIQNILLLFNLETLNNLISNQKDFEFNRFKFEKWSLEHIHSQNSKSVKNKDEAEQEDWLNKVIKFYEDSKEGGYAKELEKYKKKEKLSFDEIADKIDEFFSISEEMHIISNLTLLDKESNSKIGNETFDIKRKLVQELAKTNKLIPHCTGEVFAKNFSTAIGDDNLWNKGDRKDYLNAIKKELKEFLGE